MRYLINDIKVLIHIYIELPSKFLNDSIILLPRY